MSHLTSAALQRFARQFGVASAATLEQDGVGANTRRRLVRVGLLESVHKGVYRVAAVADTIESKCLALCLAHPAGYISGPTAGRLSGLRRMPPAESIHFVVPHGYHLEGIDGVVIHQSRSIMAGDVTRRCDGMAIASPQRLILDLASTLTVEDLTSVIEQTLHERRCSYFSLVWFVRRLAHPRRPGSFALARLLVQRGDVRALESHPEVRLESALKKRGIPVLRQHWLLELPGDRPIRIDLSIPDIRWAIEIDVHPDHLFLRGTTRDKQRDRRCHQIGWQVDRVTELDMIDVERIADELRAIYVVRLAMFTA